MSLKPTKKHAKWTAEEDAELRRRCEAGEYLEEVAAVLGRSIEGVRTRANVLGIACRSGRKASHVTRTAKPARRSPYRLVCRRSDGSTASLKDLNAPDDSAAMAAARACSSAGGCEVWRTGDDPQLLGRF